MISIADRFDRIDSLVDNYEYESAFILLNQILNDNKATNKDIADALLMKGLIVGAFAPYLTEFDHDETGLAYYLKAFEYNKLELGILFNILNSFTEHDMRQEYTRKNKHMFVKAYEILKNELYDTLNESMREQLKKMKDRYDEFKQT